MKSFSIGKRVSLILFLFLCINFPFNHIYASEFEYFSNNNPSYRFFSELPSIKGNRKLLSDSYLAKKGEIFTVQKDIYEEGIVEDVETVEIATYPLNKKTATEEGETEKDSFDAEGETEKDPFDAEGETEKDPFDAEGETEKDPFDAESETEKDPFDAESETEKDPFDAEGETEKVAMPATIPDNIEGFNRSMFAFNDKMYFWVLKPVSQGYGFITPEVVRRGIVNFFDNLSFPLRFFNCLFQGKVKDSGVEAARFGINTTIGIVGFIDVAEKFSLEAKEEDFDQTFAVYGFETGTYVMLPILGPSSRRGVFAKLGDTIFDPVTYIPFGYVFKKINTTSFRIGDYEALKDASLDPYVAIRDAYYQHRKELINK